MIRDNRVQMVLIVIVFIGAIVFAQDKQPAETQHLRVQILSVYKAQGEQGLWEFYQKNKDKITGKFIIYFAKAGVKERKEEWLNICEIMAVEKKDKKYLADVLYQKGRYYRLISDYKNAFDHFNMAFPIYLKLGDSIGLGLVYQSKALINYFLGNNSRAIELIKNASSYSKYFKNEKAPLYHGNLHLVEGIIYERIGENSKAIASYFKAKSFFKK